MTRFHVFLAFVAIMLLRVVVGFHFFKEGTNKLTSDTFTAEHFLRAAKGPWAPMFLGMLDDHDGGLRFCYDEEKHDLDPTLTFALWDDFLDRVSQHYELGSASIQSRLSVQREELAEQIVTARANRDASIDTRSLELLRSDLEQEILRIRGQMEAAEAILESHQKELRGWLVNNRTELLAYFGTRDRVDGFDRDGKSRKEVAVFVESLRGQVDTVKSDREKQLRQWAGAVESMWDSYESQVIGQLTDEQTNNHPTLKLHRPFAQENSKLQWINRIIPWFDTIVGALLILGLFTRLASAAGAMFLASVIATQPPWIPGSQPTYLYTVELLALVVIFATLAGRMGGLDFFLAVGRKKQETAETSA